MSKKILIIEDEKNLARFVSLELQHEGYSVVVETNGRLGLQTALDDNSKQAKEGQAKEGLLGLRLNPQNRSAVRGDDEISLTKREYDLLSVLLSNVNRVMTREELLASVWRYDTDIETNVVDVYIRYLRGKIDIPGKESYIQTVRGMGYIIREK